MTEFISIPLIKFTNEDGFVFTEEANQYLSNLSPETPIGLISVVGKYRTGKSYFINKVLLNKKKAFKIGATINACTKVIIFKIKKIKLKSTIGSLAS